MADTPASAESRLTRLIDRLLTGANGAITDGDLDLAREMASDVLMVDPDNQRAHELVRTADQRQRSRRGERTVMTILFSDLVDSTPMADAEEPELVRDVFALYREEAKLAVERFGGRIDNYLGDGVVATFGYPELHEDDARRAVSAGLELVAGMERVEERARVEHGVDTQVRVGIHTGLVVVADIGTGKATERDAIVGVTPNLAARIQSAAQPGQVVISDVTQHIVESDFDLESMGAHSLKGIAREVELYVVRGTRHVSERLATERFVAAPMVGRDDVAAQLTDMWTATSGGEAGKATLLLGQAGIGKSRAVAEFRTQVEAAGGSLFDMGCLPYYTNSALWPAAQSLLKRVGIPSNASAEDRLERLQAYIEGCGLPIDPNLALLAPLVGVDEVPGHPAPQLDPTALRQAVLATLLAVIVSGVGEQPRALVVEDIHWADPSTLDLLGMVVEAATPGLLLLMTSRVPVEAPWAGGFNTLDLDRLGDEAAGDLIDTLAGDAPVDDATRASIIERGAGIPLFIEELTRTAITSGGALPVRLQELLASRLRQPGVDLELAQTAATIGNEFDAELLGDLMGDADEIGRRLQSLEEAEIIDRLDATGGHFRFHHALLRDAAYETQVLEGRRDWHGRIAGAMVDRGGDAAVVARHFDLAGAVGEAIAQYGVATQAAQATGAHAEASQLATRALELVAQMEDGPERNITELGMLMLRGFSISSMRGYAAPEVEADFRRANELSEALGTAPEVMPAAFAIWSFVLVAGDVPSAALLAARLRGRVEDGSGAWFAPEVEAALGYQALYEGDLTEASSAFARSLAGFEARPPEQMVSEYWPLPNDPVAVARIGQAVVLTLQGKLAEGAAMGDAAVARSEEVPFPMGPFSVAFVKVYLAWLALIVGDLESSQRLGEETIAIGQQYGYAYWMALGGIYNRVSDPDLEAFQQA
ncbi:MAG: ATP-binding protein, partial [Acidimicrobiia bacterium]